MLDAGQRGLIHEHCDLSRHCNVTVRGKMRESNLNNRNDFSNWLRSQQAR